MSYVRSCGSVVFTRKGREILYIIAQYTKAKNFLMEANHYTKGFSRGVMLRAANQKIQLPVAIAP